MEQNKETDEDSAWAVMWHLRQPEYILKESTEGSWKGRGLACAGLEGHCVWVRGQAAKGTQEAILRGLYPVSLYHLIADMETELGDG